MDNSLNYSVTLGSIIDEFQLETVNSAVDRERKVERNEVNRPGLALAGFFEKFHSISLQTWNG